MKTRTLLLLAALLIGLVAAIRTNSLQTLRLWLGHLMHFLSRENLPLPYPAPPPPEQWQAMSPADRLASVRSRLLPRLDAELTAKGLKLSRAAYIRIFKETREFELWLKDESGDWRLFRNYPIATFSGTLGPKTREGDMQAPEGFYTVTRKQLNPASSYHLAFNIGYPNAFDLAHQRTGSLIMVHGRRVSIGCFAMTDPLIEEIYLVVEAALTHSDAVPVHIFPFRMSAERNKKEQTSPQHDFWENLRPAYNIFEKDHRIPEITVENSLYHAR